VSGEEELRARAVLSEMLMRISQGPYAALSLPETASAEQVRASFLDLTKQFHPARFGRMSPEIHKLANEVFLGIKGAHDQLLKSLGSSRFPQSRLTGTVPGVGAAGPDTVRGTGLSSRAQTPLGRGTDPLNRGTDLNRGSDLNRGGTDPLNRGSELNRGGTDPLNRGTDRSGVRPSTPRLTPATGTARPSTPLTTPAPPARPSTPQITQPPRASTPPAGIPVQRPGTPPGDATERRNTPPMGIATQRPTPQLPASRPSTPPAQRSGTPDPFNPPTHRGAVDPLNPPTHRGAIDPLNPPTNRGRVADPRSAGGAQASGAIPRAAVSDEQSELRHAMNLLSSKDWSGARLAFHALAAKVPQSRQYRALLCYVRGRETQAIGRADDAVMEFQRALQLDPDLQLAKDAIREVQRKTR
jgi:hypothetical protein